jgi:hypothetical protein
MNDQVIDNVLKILTLLFLSRLFDHIHIKRFILTYLILSNMCSSSI